MDYLDMKAWPERLEADERFRDDHLYAMETMVSGAAGPHYSRGKLGPYMPENHYHAYTSLMVSRLMFDNPKVRCTTRRPGSQIETAEAIRHGLNRWVRDVNLRRTGQQIAVDYCYTWGVSMVRQIPNRWMGKTAEKWVWAKDGSIRVDKPKSLWPAAYRIPQPQFILDSSALTLDRADYMGHVWYAAPDTLLAEAKRGEAWDAKAVEELARGVGTEGGSPQQSDVFRQNDPRQSPKPELELITIWVPELFVGKADEGPDEGYHGTMLTLARAQGRGPRGKWREVKRPEPYFGPPTGPYHVWGAYTLPNALMPLGPLVAVEGQVREVNRHARAISRSAEKHKRVLLYEARDQATANRIKKARHDHFIGIPGFDRAKYAEAEIGGVTDVQYKQTAYLMDRLNRVSAMDEAQQGNVTGLGTATEHSIANESAMSRLAYLRQQFADGVTKGVLEKAAWFMYHDSRVVFPLGEDAADDFEMEEPWFHGGMDDPDAQFDDLELEIEAYSMQRADQQAMAAQAQAGLNWLLQTAQLRPMMPFIDWERVDDMAAQAFDLPDLAGLVDNQAALEAVPFQDGGQQEQPRLSLDVGSAASYGRSFTGPARKAAPAGPQAQAQALPGGNAGLSMMGGAP